MKSINKVMAITILSSLFGAHAFAGNLEVEVTGIAEAKGKVMVAVYNDKGLWMKRPMKANMVAVTGEKVSLKFENLPEGEYAVSLFHDVNENGKMDSNEMRMPLEPYGFSNNAIGNYGPPTFEQAKFVIDAADKTISIKIN